MANEAETDDTATQDRLRSAALNAVLDLVCGLAALERLANADPPASDREMDEWLHGFRVLAGALRERAYTIGRALDSVPGPRERLALLEGEA